MRALRISAEAAGALEEQCAIAFVLRQRRGALELLAARHAWRARVVPVPPVARSKCSGQHGQEEKEERGDTLSVNAKAFSRPKSEPPQGGSRNGRAAFTVPESEPFSTVDMSAFGERIGPNVLSVAHGERLLDGELYPTRTRVDWALLLRRTFDVDLRPWARCGGALSIRVVVTDPEAIARIFGGRRRGRDPPVAL